MQTSFTSPRTLIIAENFINGNLTYARHAASRHSQKTLAMSFMALGCSKDKATLSARYLKGEHNLWQAACDAT